MASEMGLEAYFATMRQQGYITVHETPRFELDSYIQNYPGRSRFDRLLLIGQTSVALHIDALRAAVAEAKKSRDTGRYQRAAAYLRIRAPEEAEKLISKSWIDSTDATNAMQTKRLERELKVYKNNLVKESIRMGHEELGRHLEAIGNLMGAAEAYSRMRPDVSTPKHIVDMGKHLVSVYVQRKEWASVVSQLSKITGIQGADEEKLTQPYIMSMSGLGLLGQKSYESAASCFLAVDGSSTSITAATDGFLCANDIAVYGGLLALATMDRKQLQTAVLENNKFRAFLELEPHIRRAITHFVNGRYADCLSILASYRADYMLDLYLHWHLDAIYDKIRIKCITNYLVPYSCVTLESMEAAFSVPGQSVEAELAGMIRAKTINARIDSINGLVRMVKEKPRVRLHMDALKAVSSFEKTTLDRLRRVNIAAAELEVKSARKGLNAPDSGEVWFDRSTPVTM
ncbi:hypothetical protein SEPCBS119000_005192 [Sporothrix epigloea]|uniref:PCI domain-containing protein n=1 Tax=Sporothrix epigloea TaxID=1892477 RepID=A0ABP0DYF5_9PEZI